MEIIQKHSGQVIVLVSHTVVIRLLLLAILKLRIDQFWNLRQDPCAINVTEYDGDGFLIVKLNDTCHVDILNR